MTAESYKEQIIKLEHVYEEYKKQCKNHSEDSQMHKEQQYKAANTIQEEVMGGCVVCVCVCVCVHVHVYVLCVGITLCKMLCFRVLLCVCHICNIYCQIKIVTND